MSKSKPAVDEEERNEDPQRRPASRRSSSRSVARLEVMPRIDPDRERGEDRLEPELAGDAGDHRDQGEVAADADLGAGSLAAAASRLGDALRMRARRREGEQEQPGRGPRTAHRWKISVPAPGALAGVEEGEQDHRPELGYRRRRDHLLAPHRCRSRRAFLSGTMMMLQRGGDEDDRHQERRLDQADRVEGRGRRRTRARSEMREPAPSDEPRSAPRSRSTWISRPARNSRQARPTSRTPATGGVDDAIVEPRAADDDPADELEHDRRDEDPGASARINGARKAITATMTKLV